MKAEANIPLDAPKPRLCHMVKRPDFDGYGFNLHAEKAKPGQFIGQIDAASPAEAAGLKKGDRLIEVNGVHVGQENHRQVVQRIKSQENETTLLVVDKATEDYYAKLGIVITSDLPGIQKLSSDKRIAQSHLDNQQLQPAEPRSETPRRSQDLHEEIEESLEMDSTATSLESNPPTDSNKNDLWDGLNLNITAAEMRQRIYSRKKKDPRNEDKIDLQKKYEIIQTL